MRLLLTSGGVTNDSIRRALVEMLPRPIEQCRALFIPTAQWGQPLCSPQSVRRSVVGGREGISDMVDLGWASVGLLELTTLPSVGAERWMPWVRDADVLLVDGGEAVFLAHWLRESGLIALAETLDELVWVGVSAGSMALTPRIGPLFVDWAGAPSDETLGLVDFSIFPHLDYPGWDENTLARAREWARGIPNEAYAIDDETAIVVDGGRVQVISEGHWEHFAAGRHSDGSQEEAHSGA